MLLYKKLSLEDIPEATKLALKVFMEFEAPDYSKEGIKTFKEFIDVENLKKNYRNGNMIFFGCFSDFQLISVIASRGENHISLFFTSREYQNKGVGKKLLGMLEDEFIEAGENITVNSSPYAVHIYEKLGFRKTDREKTIDGIRFTPMIKIINK